jgi:hypothetical protein
MPEKLAVNTKTKRISQYRDKNIHIHSITIMSRAAPNVDTEVDLDIDNYDLNDLLGLFQLDVSYSETDLARAKRLVLKMHPDKSRLDAKFFLFYSKAYKTLYQLWKFRNVGDSKSESRTSSNNGPREREQMVYVSDTSFDRDTSGNGELLNRMFRENSALRKAPDFNRWFNAEFEKVRVESSDADGYGDWLTNEDMNESEQVQGSTGQMMAAFTEKKRKACQDIVVHQEVESFYGGLGGGMGSDLGGSSDTYDSVGSSSGVGYQDLRKAHTETMIPVSDADLAQRKTFGSVDEIRRHRTSQNIVPLSTEESHRMLSEQTSREDENAVRRAFRLTKEVEESERRSQQFWKNLRMLKDK